ncbi:MAG: hypothetical protein AAFV01_17755, partial [Bacteroidota bacterium]
MKQFSAIALMHFPVSASQPATLSDTSAGQFAAIALTDVSLMRHVERLIDLTLRDNMLTTKPSVTFAS